MQHNMHVTLSSIQRKHVYLKGFSSFSETFYNNLVWILALAQNK